MKIYVFLAEGFEEIEAVAPIDIFRRAGIHVVTVSVTGNRLVTGSHSIPLMSDILIEDVKVDDDSLIFLPGGLPGTYNLDAHVGLKSLLLKQYESGEKIAAICAAPSVIGKMGMLNNKDAICYPGFEEQLKEAKISQSKIVFSENIYTAKAAGVAIQFALGIVEQLRGAEIAKKIKEGIYLD